MERVTEKRVIYPVCRKGETPEKREFIYIKNKAYAENKLFVLENIEQEFGVGLNILLKDVHNPIDFIRKFGVSRIWFFDDGKLQKADIHNLDYNKDVLHLLTNDGWHTTRKVSDYGKTWALTREELENGR